MYQSRYFSLSSSCNQLHLLTNPHTWSVSFLTSFLTVALTLLVTTHIPRIFLSFRIISYICLVISIDRVSLHKRSPLSPNKNPAIVASLLVKSHCNGNMEIYARIYEMPHDKASRPQVTCVIHPQGQCVQRVKKCTMLPTCANTNVHHNKWM